MTICVAVRVFDGLVFAADSATTLTARDLKTGQESYYNVYNHGNKVFNLYKGLPIAAMTCGVSNFGDASIATLAKDLRRRLVGGEGWALDKGNYSIGQVVDAAKRFLFDERFSALDPKPLSPFEFWIGGYGSGDDARHELWRLSIEKGQCSTDSFGDPGSFGINWSGATDPISRLILGFDHTLMNAIGPMLPPGTDLGAVYGAIKARTTVELSHPTMPIRDAIDLAEFLAETAKRYHRFKPGADIVGGDIDVATVTRHEGFKWVKRKHFYPPHLNPLETDHV